MMLLAAETRVGPMNFVYGFAFADVRVDELIRGPGESQSGLLAV